MYKLILIFIGMVTLFSCKEKKEDGHQYMIVGTYTSGKSEGIYVYDFNSADGTYKELSHVKTSNPSYIAV
mgnify:FL=1